MDRLELEVAKRTVRRFTDNGSIVGGIENPWGISDQSLTILFLGVVEKLNPKEIHARLHPKAKGDDRLVRGTVDMLHDSKRMVEKADPVDSENWHPVVVAIDASIERGVAKADEAPTLTPDNSKDGERPNENQVFYPPKCPRCQGLMIHERDWYGEYAYCLLCGYVHEAASTPPIELLMGETNDKEGRRGGQVRHGKTNL